MREKVPIIVLLKCFDFAMGKLKAVTTVRVYLPVLIHYSYDRRIEDRLS